MLDQDCLVIRMAEHGHTGFMEDDIERNFAGLHKADALSNPKNPKCPALLKGPTIETSLLQKLQKHGQKISN